MSTVAQNVGRGPVAAVVLITSSAALLAVAVVGGAASPALAVLVLLVTALALSRPGFIGWPRILAALVLIIMFIPIRRYSLPGSLPFELEPYRIFIGLLVIGWLASLLVDQRTRLRRTGFEGPLILIVGAAMGSIVANPARVAQFGSEINKSLTFFLSFVVLLYLISSVLRGIASAEFLTKSLVAGGTAVARLRDHRGPHGFQRLQPPHSRPSHAPTGRASGSRRLRASRSRQVACVRFGGASNRP